MRGYKNPSILAAMAGITNGDFANKCLTQGGAGLVTIGGFPVGYDMILAANEAVQRGRIDFLLTHGKEREQIAEEALRVSEIPKLILNLRFNKVKDAQKFINLFSDDLLEKPVIEINAHCQQEEVTSRGGGQALLYRLEILGTIIKTIQAKDFKVSLKFRGNAINSNILIPQIERWDLDFLHIDAYKEGEDKTDLDLLRKYFQKINSFLIGNNSVVDSKSAHDVLNTGARFFSIARAAQKNPLIFNDLIKMF